MLKNAFLFYLFLFSAITVAQSFIATVDNNKVAENDRFQLQFTFEGKNLNALKSFNPPSLKDFRVLSGPNQSQSMQIVNGVSSSSLTLSYILMPNTTGSFTIGSASIQYEGQTLTTSPIKVSVVKASQKPKEENSSGVSNQEIAENLFIRASIDKNKVYLGEQVTVSYKIYTRLNMGNGSIDKQPQYQGFWAEVIDLGQNDSYKIEILDGKQYKTRIFKRVALFPTQTGSLQITPLESTIQIQVQKKKNPNNVWDDFFGDPFGRAEIIDYQTQSNTLKIDVLPLPENNKPASFRGAVGNFNFSASIDKQKTKTNEPITLKFDISGTGNLKLLELPPFELPNGFEKYDPKTDEQINRSGKIGGTKKAEYLLIPRIAGAREIPAIEFSYFDPETKSYKTIRSKSFNVEIEQGQGSAEDYADQQNIQQLDNDIRYIKTKFDDVELQGDVLILKPEFWAASILPMISAFVLIGWKRKQDKLSGNQQLLRYSKAEKVARKRFKTAKKLLDVKNIELFYSEISQALFGYLEDKFHIPKSEFTLDRAADELLKRNIKPELVEKMKTNAQKCEFIRFAPGTNPSQAMNEMYQAFSDVVIDIERSIAK